VLTLDEARRIASNCRARSEQLAEIAVYLWANVHPSGGRQMRSVEATGLSGVDASRRARPLVLRGDTIVFSVVLGLALLIGLTTAADFGLTIDEFNVDDYGPKALAWYTSGFIDRSQFETVQPWLWAYGPWLQILVAIAQAFGLADPMTVRHALTFVVGLLGLTGLLPIARLTFGGWAGVAAIGLCLTTGYFYGHLFFTPIDVPFMAAMTLATLAIIVMASRQIPTWWSTFGAGLALGLAMGTRTAGIITHVYLVGAMFLVALEVVLTQAQERRRMLVAIASRTLVAITLAWVVAILIWPWLQIGNPFTQFVAAHKHFWTLENVFSFPSWGQTVTTNALPWHYIPGQLLARLPEGFLLLLCISVGLGIAATVKFAHQMIKGSRHGLPELEEPLLSLARARGILVIVTAAFGPPIIVILSGSTLYDGVRHLLFIVPMLALLASGALVKVLSWARAFPAAITLLCLLLAAHLAGLVRNMVLLHPLEYVAMNALAGGTQGAYGRFELDYWSAAATEAVRRLEERHVQQATKPDASDRQRVLVYLPWPTPKAHLLFRRNWAVETDVSKADYVIATERAGCGERANLDLVDRVERLGMPFACTYKAKE
jgi:hypothetical protein